jgi:hypothetical protein
MSALAQTAVSRHPLGPSRASATPNVVHSQRGSPWPQTDLRIAETVNHPFRLIEVCYGLSVVYLRQGDVPRAIPVLERAMGLCQDWHIPRHSGLGMLYTKIGQQEQARAELSTAMEMYRTMEMTFWLPQVEAALAQVE